MKRNNQVILMGQMNVQDINLLNLDGMATPAVISRVTTDVKDMGGYHPVIIYGRLAAEVAAFSQAVNGGKMEVVIFGWLRSTDGKSMVVADRITFHVSNDIRVEARKILNQTLSGKMDLSFSPST